MSRPKGNRLQGASKAGPPTHIRPITDRLKIDAIMEAISTYDVHQSPAWDDLESLSSHTYIDELEAVPEGIFETDFGFTAAVTVYVSLNYGSKNDALSVTDSFPAQAEGHFEQKGRSVKAIIDSLSVDTASFYE